MCRTMRLRHYKYRKNSETPSEKFENWLRSGEICVCLQNSRLCLRIPTPETPIQLDQLNVGLLVCLFPVDPPLIEVEYIE